MQSQLEVFLEAINKYFWDRLERNNVILELNCAFQKTDVFEPFTLEYKMAEGERDDEVDLLKKPFAIDHEEGDIISIIFADARQEHHNAKIGEEIFY